MTDTETMKRIGVEIIELFQKNKLSVEESQFVLKKLLDTITEKK